MKFHALAHWLWKRHVPLLPALLCGINRVVFSVNLPAQTQIGRGTVLKHNGLGVVIHRRAVIGQRVFINPGAVIGGRAGHKPVPVIEDDVEIGVGAKVLGPVRIGRGAIVGANAVVLHDVPAGAVVVGIPARILRRRELEPVISRFEDTGT